MSPSPATATPERRMGAWLDDLAAIVASWLDQHPVRRRLLLLLIAVFSGSALLTLSSYIFVALLLLLLPRMPRLRGRVVSAVGLLLALAGTAIIVLADRTWSSFPMENGGGLTLLAIGVLLGARRGLWLPWLLFGVACGVVINAPFAGALFLQPAATTGVLALILVARVSAAPRPIGDVRAARGRLAVALQGRPWLTSFVLCALAAAAPGTIFGIAPAISAALVALLFHCTWRIHTFFDKASAWTAALVIPPLNIVLFWWIPSLTSDTNPFVMAGRSWWDAALTPAMALPLLLGLLLGRRAPGQRFGAADWVLLVIATTGAPAVATMVLLAGTPTQYAQIPAIYRVGMDHPHLWMLATTAAWIPLFHRVVATTLSARRIVIGAAACGSIQLVGVLIATHDPDSTVVISRGALYPIVMWVAAALVLLLAREVARVTRVPDDHQLSTDYERVRRGAQKMR